MVTVHCGDPTGFGVAEVSCRDFVKKNSDEPWTTAPTRGRTTLASVRPGPMAQIDRSTVKWLSAVVQVPNVSYLVLA